MFNAFIKNRSSNEDHSQCKLVKFDDSTCFEHHFLPALGDKFRKLGFGTGESSEAFLRVDCCGQIDETRIRNFSDALKYFGVRATFYLLPPGSYVPLENRGLENGSNYFGSWKESELNVNPRLPDLVAFLAEAGHDVGLHNDVVSHSLRLARPAAELLQMQLDGLRSSGIPIRSSAAHGSPLCRMLVYNNREIFTGIRRPKRVPDRELCFEGFCQQLGQLEQAEYGLEFEAYELPRPQRLSDAGGNWAGRIQGRPIKQVYPEGLVTARDVASEVSLSVSGVLANSLHILLHPKYWRVM